MIRRKIVARRLREFFAYMLARVSGGSTELFERIEKSASPDRRSEGSAEKPPLPGQN